MQDSWPSVEPEAERGSSLPRVEELPVVAQGYDPERVREAFDAFYRHLARLDATLRTIEAVEAFRDQAGELRKELRALRSAGWTQEPWLPSYSARESVRPGLPDAVFRWALEACLVIAAPVAASAADLRTLWIVIAAAAAVAIVAAAEWLASLERPLVPTRPAAPEAPAEPSAPPEPEPSAATEWTQPPRAAEQVEAKAEEAEAEEAQEAEELTAVAKAPPAREPEEPSVEAEEAAPEPAAEEPEQQRRRRWPWRRKRESAEEEAGRDEDRPRHVRVIPAEAGAGIEPPLDPWEEELDLEVDLEPEPEPRDVGAA